MAIRDFLTRSVAVAVPTLAIALATACDDTTPACRVTLDVPLSGVLAGFPNVRLDRAGATFVAVGEDETYKEIRFASLSEAGVLDPAATILPLPAARTAGPWFGLAGKTVPGDQLQVIYGAASATTPGALALWQITVPSGSAATDPGRVPRPFADPDGTPMVLPGPPVPGKIEIAMGSARDGSTAIVAWSVPTADGPALVALLVGPDGVTKRLPAPFPLTLYKPPSARCLAITPSRTGGFGVSRILDPATPDGKPSWWFAELDATGVITDSYEFESSSDVVGCPTVGPTPKGYLLAWQNRVGTYFAEVEPTPSGLFINSNIAKGAVRFGGPDRQPPVACVASVGYNLAFTFDGPTPSIELHSPFGEQVDGTLILDSGRRSGPLSAWPSDASWFLTYLGESAGTATRKFVKIDCGSSPDAAPSM